jgi:hypothetical protein
MKRFALLAGLAILVTTGGQAFATDESPMATPQAKPISAPQRVAQACAWRGEKCGTRPCCSHFHCGCLLHYGCHCR